ncbi:MAG: hypothetical protein KGN79_04695 [Acidobacteriota bacterium]|nr:hypothetical protein [Acidobacteriota bacterium]
MTDQPMRRAEQWAVFAACAVASAMAACWSWQHNAMLNYGDAVAHLHIARRTFDSHQPGFEQLGSVWLPLPHILMVPFVAVYSWWANGIAGLIPSALAYLASCIAMYGLARHWLTPAASAAALAFFALNPNLLYLQTTAMTEPLFLCIMLWTALWLVEWRLSLDSAPLRTNRLQWLVALALVAAIFTRYDGWILALLAWTGMGIVLLRRGKLRQRSFWWASALVVAAPLFWFAYNQIAFGDWLGFARGPYSAAAIEARTSTGSGPPHPGWHNPWVSFLFFMKCAELDTAAQAWANTMLVISLMGTLYAWFIARRRAITWALLLWLPVPFYAYSIAWGSVPIFLPVWWPHSYYNTRYGMELLPALALGIGFAVFGFIRGAQTYRSSLKPLAATFAFALIAWNSWKILADRPLTYVEGTWNVRSRLAYESEIPPTLRALLANHPGAEILMNTSYDPMLVALTGIPLHQTINEGDFHTWERALTAPANHASIVLAFDGDEVARAVEQHPECLRLVRQFHTPGQPSASLYISLNKAPTQ